MYYIVAHSVAPMQHLFLLSEVWGFPKLGMGVLTPSTSPPSFETGLSFS